MGYYRVDATSNHGDETYAESTVIANVTEMQADRIAEILNEGADDVSRTFYSVRHKDQRLWRGMEDLV